MNNSAAPGWYPVDNDPSNERFFDGTQWTSDFRPVGGAMAPPPPQPGSAFDPGKGPESESKSFFKKKRFLIPAALVGILVVASALSANDDREEAAETTEVPVAGADSDADADESSATTDPAETEAAELVDADDDVDATTTEAPAEEEEATTTEAPAEEEPNGSADRPYPFGQAHTRDPGVLGAGWTISIDEVRTEGIPLDPFWIDEGETGVCVAIIGSATLDSLDSDELTSNPFSFPSPTMIAGGSKIDSGFLECDNTGLEAEGLTWILDVELAEGGSVQWFETYFMDSIEYETIAIESTIYSNS